MAYTTIQPPFTLKFREMPRKELKEYYKWFHDVMPTRIEELTAAVNDSEGFDNWKPDYTPDSLESLGRWLIMQVEKQPTSEKDRQEIASRVPKPLVLPELDLTNRTFSLAMDVAMYLSKVFLKNHPSLQWEQPLSGSKKFVDYGQPVLTGFGNVPFNTVRMVVTLAYGLAEKKHKGERLAELYDVWAKMVK